MKALVLSGYGINCEREMALAAHLAGAEVETVHAKAWLLGEKDLSTIDLLLLPGGFSFGDELGAAKAFANRIRFSGKAEELHAFVEKGRCILGVCNGFQLLVKLGLLPGFKKKAQVALTRNVRCHFESRWVYQKVLSSRCIFTKGVEELYLPVRHGEGNFVTEEKAVVEDLFTHSQVALQYATLQGEVAEHYPENPNGSLHAIAGICDPTGRILGLMPHPEAAIFFTQLPDWTRRKEKLKRQGLPLPVYGPGFALFTNAVNYLRQS